MLYDVLFVLSREQIHSLVLFYIDPAPRLGPHPITVYMLEEVLKPGHEVHFTVDASKRYWVVPMKESNCNKTGFVTPNGSWVYLRMGQGLKVLLILTYFQFSDLDFGTLSATKDKSIPWQDRMIGTKEDSVSSIDMDDHVGAAKSLYAMFIFLHTQYFLRVSFGPV